MQCEPQKSTQISPMQLNVGTNEAVTMFPLYKQFFNYTGQWHLTTATNTKSLGSQLLFYAASLAIIL